MPFSVHNNVDHPVSLYAATKKSNELMAHTYAHLYQIPTTGLRFFTVYGPWGRPDMALFLFTKNILAGKPIDVFNYGNHRRDFTYIDDIVEGVIRTLDKIPSPNEDWSGDHPDPATSKAPYKLYNIGNNNPVELRDYIATLEKCLGKKAHKTTPSENTFIKATRSIVAKEAILKGQVISPDNITTKRPFLENCIPAKEFYNLQGKYVAKKDMEFDQLITWNDVVGINK